MNNQPSHTALSVARHRYMHQTYDEGSLLHEDRIVGTLLQEEPVPTRRQLRKLRSAKARKVRTFLAMRASLAEQLCLARLRVEQEGLQIVILGAGLDTMAYRCTVELEEGKSRVFEVDREETQSWKRLRLEECGIHVPANVEFVPFNLEEMAPGGESLLLETLAAHHFTSTRPAFFVVLGVVPYLQRDAFLAVLRQLSVLPSCDIVFDYGLECHGSPRTIERFNRRSEKVRSMGEPWITHFRDPAEVRLLFSQCGWDDDSHYQDYGSDLLAKHFNVSHDWMQDEGPHVCRIVHARTCVL